MQERRHEALCICFSEDTILNIASIALRGRTDKFGSLTFEKRPAALENKSVSPALASVQPLAEQKPNCILFQTQPKGQPASSRQMPSIACHRVHFSRSVLPPPVRGRRQRTSISGLLGSSSSAARTSSGEHDSTIAARSKMRRDGPPSGSTACRRVGARKTGSDRHLLKTTPLGVRG